MAKNKRRDKHVLGILRTMSVPDLNRITWKMIGAMSDVADEHGFDLGVFSLNDIDGNKANATFLDSASTDGWEKRETALPRVVYDLHSRLKRRIPEGFTSYDITGFIKKKRITTVNTPEFRELADDKLRTYRALAELERTHGIIQPETISLRDEKGEANFAMLENLCREGTVYIKGRTGGGGSQVRRIRQAGRGGYELKSSKIETLYDSLTQLFYSKRFSNVRENPSRYIAQKGIDVIMHRESVVDLRVGLQRGRDGELTFKQPVVRVGKQGSHISNWRGGGRAAEPYEVLQDAETVVDEAVSQAVAVNHYLEQSFGHIGEASVDFLIERSGKLFVCEINAMPGKSDIYTAVGPYKEMSYPAQLDIRNGPFYRSVISVIEFMIHLHEHQDRYRKRFN